MKSLFRLTGQQAPDLADLVLGASLVAAAFGLAGGLPIAAGLVQAARILAGQ